MAHTKFHLIRSDHPQPRIAVQCRNISQNWYHYNSFPCFHLHSVEQWGSQRTIHISITLSIPRALPEWQLISQAMKGERSAIFTQGEGRSNGDFLLVNTDSLGCIMMGCEMEKVSACYIVMSCLNSHLFSINHGGFCSTTGRVIDPTPGAWFITKFISLAQVVPG